MTLPRLLLAVLFLGPVACGGDDGDDSGNDSNDSNGDDDSGGSNATNATNPQTQTSSTEEECVTSHQCVGAACTCTTPGLENMPCTDDTACEDECRICM